MNADNIEKECESFEEALSERIEAHDESRAVAQDKLHEFCEGLRAQVAELKSRVNEALRRSSPRRTIACRSSSTNCARPTAATSKRCSRGRRRSSL